jgi:RimJ/RimL family protein N-acetyltransferase
VTPPSAASRFRFAGGPRRPAPGITARPDDRDLVWFEDGSGLTLGLRPIHPDDKSALLAGFERLSDESRYQRFLAPMERLTARQVRYLTEIDQVNHFAWAAGIRSDDGSEIGIGVARYVRDPNDPGAAEIAVVVADDHQRRGIGTLLVESLVLVAAERDILQITAFMFAENAAAVRIFERLGSVIAPDSPGVLRAHLELPPPGGTSIDPDGRDELLWVACIAAHPSHSPCR